MKEEQFDKIDRYIRKEMSLEELSAFEKEVESNQELREELRLSEDIAQNLASRQKKMEKMDLWKSQSKHAARNRYFAIGAISVAASLLLGVFILKPDTSLYKPEIEGYIQSEMNFRGVSSSMELERLLRSGHYKESLPLIDSLEITYRKSLHESISLDSLSEEQQYEQETAKLALYNLQWLRIQAMIGTGELEGAVRLLDKFRKEDGEFREKADSLRMIIKHTMQ